jgi:aspartate 1-decarboxylase
MITMLKAKLHRGTVTQSDLNYEGSITVDRDLLDAAGILVYEQVDVLNINSGSRFTTYTIPGERGKGEVCVNGAAARLVQKGDLVIICAYTHMEEAKARNFEPKVVLLDENNRVKENGAVAA